MRAIERILDQLNRAWGGPSWTEVEIRPLLDGISDEQARSHPIPNAHSIIELVSHMVATMDEASFRLVGSPRELTTEEAWRDVAELPWSTAVEELEHAQSRICDAVARLDTADLDKIAAGKNYSNYTLVHGVLQHNLYHLGQIALLKKML